MAFLPWKKQYSVEVPLFDDQHRKLFELINNLVTSLKREKGSEGYESAVNGLLDYTREHFRSEEENMRRLHYPGYGEHLRAHELLTERVETFRSGSQQGDPDELLRFLMDWLVNHIMGIDKKYSAFFKTHLDELK